MRYSSGEDARVGDRVHLDGEPGVVVEVLVPQSDEAIAWGQPRGGMLIKSDALGVVLVAEPAQAEDLTLDARG